ncbi:MAG: alpha/beta hydrolase, partial [Rhodospirillaceae bacterium]|nr:alpha/beta hydrolase [Rhodospirillaceae bacterium]
MTTIDPALEAGYNLRIRHPEREAVYARMAEASARLRAALPCQIDVAYGPDQVETLDFFPAGADAPLIVFIHGGYWRALDKSIFSFVAKPFLDAGCAVALTNYGLAPQFPLEEIVAQSNRSIAFLAREARSLGIDASRIFVAGHSAGAHLAAMAA